MRGLEESALRTEIQTRLGIVLAVAVAVLSAGCAAAPSPAAQPVSEPDGVATMPAPTEASSESEPEPMLQTLPRASWNPRIPMHNTNFPGLNSLKARSEHFAGVGQTVRVMEPFELQRIGIYFESNLTFARPTLWDFPYDTDYRILRDHIVAPGPLDDVGVLLALTVYRSPQGDGFPTVRRQTSGTGGVPTRERDVILSADLVLVSDQLMHGQIRAGTGLTMLELTEPVVLESGHWMLALRVDSLEGELDLLDLPIRGVEYGNNRVEDAPDGARCEYRPFADAYPDGAFYWLERNPDEYFSPGFAKVQQCVEHGRFEEWTPWNPGDIGLDLFGEPVG